MAFYINLKYFFKHLIINEKSVRNINKVFSDIFKFFLQIAAINSCTKLTRCDLEKSFFFSLRVNKLFVKKVGKFFHILMYVYNHVLKIPK